MPKQLSHKMIVLSLDAMTFEDFSKARDLPGFSWFWERGALARHIRSVYPSLTYPCHAAMACGCWPEESGVFNNELFLPETRRRPWIFYHDQIRRPTIFHAARAAGLRSGCILWPCMGNAPVDYLIPEIWDGDPDSGFFEPMCRAGSAPFIREIWPEVGSIPRGFQQPMLDEFVFACLRRVIHMGNPPLIYAHVCQIDNAKHYGGLDSTQVWEAVKRTGRLLDGLLRELDALGILEETTVALCSDHGQLPVDRASYPNVLLRKRGFLTPETGSDSLHWRAQSHSACCSAQVYVAAPSDVPAVHAMLNDERIREYLGIAAVYDRSQAKKLFHLDGPFSFVLEGAPGVLFRDEWEGDSLMCSLTDAGLSYRANHGHDPARGQSPFFALKGPDVRQGALVEQADLIDEPVTIARLLGLSMPWAQGKPLDALLTTPG